jgi:alpha/beta superfamily hydrolase
MAPGTAPPAPQALLLVAGGHTCVAWWHAPAAMARAAAAPESSLAVVLASSWGDEDMAGYDGLRALAIQLAGCGLATLRFEWPDTGDSSAATGAASIADALAAFDAAATRALALSGCERLAFVGRRLGALLAAHAAAARPDVDALVAVLPVASGRAFVREQRVLPARAGAPVPMPVPGATFDAAQLPVLLGGFTQPVRHLEALSALRWPSAATTAVLEALLLRHPDRPVRAAADALARMGVRVHERTHADLRAVPAGRRRAGLAPPAALEIVRWLQERAADATVTRGVAAIEDFGVADAGNVRAHAALAAARLEAATAAVLALSAADAPVWMRLRAGGVAVRERIVQVDATEASNAPRLAGVLSERDTPAHDGAAPALRRAIVLLSSGRERRIGPQRMWVPWARHRAAAGDVVLRLDVAGSGDSDRQPGRRGNPGRGDDVARAVAWLRREHGVGPCIVMGVRSGAWRAAPDAMAVQQVIIINSSSWHGRMSALMRDAGRHGMRLLRGGLVNVREVVHAEPTFAGTAGRADLYARLDAILGSAPAPVSRPVAAAAHRPAVVAP